MGIVKKIVSHWTCNVLFKKVYVKVLNVPMGNSTNKVVCNGKLMARNFLFLFIMSTDY